MKRNTSQYENKLAVDINELQAMLSVGKNNAAKIGKDAGALVHVGRRNLYLVEMVNRYLEKKAVGEL